MQPFTPSPYAYAAPGSYQQAKPLDGLAKVVAILLGLVVLATLFASFAFFHRNQAAQDFLNLRRPGNDDLDTLANADHLVGAGVALVGIASIAAWVVWVIWQFQHAKNAERLAGKGGLAPVFAILGWITLGLLPLPQAELAGSSKASDPSLAPGAPRSGGKAVGLIWVWWVAYVAGVILFFVGTSQRPSEDVGTSGAARRSISDFADADKLVAIGVLVLAVAAVLAIFVALKTTKRQTDRIEAVAAATGASGAPAASYVPGGYGPPPAAGPGVQPPYPAGPPPATAAPAGQPGSWGPPGGEASGPSGDQPGGPAAGGESGFVVPGGTGPASGAPAPAAPSAEPGWHPDPYGEAGLRWWDGRQWTNHISGQPSS